MADPKSVAIGVKPVAVFLSLASGFRYFRYAMLPVGILAVLWYSGLHDITPAASLAQAAPYFIAVYLLLFSIGDDRVNDGLILLVRRSLLLTLAVPLALSAIIFLFLYFTDQAIKGTLLFVPLMLAAPTLWFCLSGRYRESVDWRDFVGTFICALPFFWPRFKFNTELPLSGDGFDSLYNSMLLVSAIYAVVIVRGIRGIGLRPVLNAGMWPGNLLGWSVFMAIAITIGVGTGYMTWTGYASGWAAAWIIAWRTVEIFLHTALREELIIRGLLQNLIAQRLAASLQWGRTLIVGLVILLPVTVWVGYALPGPWHSLPLFVAVYVFGFCWAMERTGRHAPGEWTAIALISVFFGLLHFGKDSQGLVAIAMFSGVLYGWVWMRTRNIFHVALVHALVNSVRVLFVFFPV